MGRWLEIRCISRCAGIAGASSNRHLAWSYGVLCSTAFAPFVTSFQQGNLGAGPGPSLSFAKIGDQVSAKFVVKNSDIGPRCKFMACPAWRRDCLWPSVKGTTAVTIKRCFNNLKAFV